MLNLQGFWRLEGVEGCGGQGWGRLEVEVAADAGVLAALPALEVGKGALHERVVLENIAGNELAGVGTEAEIPITTAAAAPKEAEPEGLVLVFHADDDSLPGLERAVAERAVGADDADHDRHADGLALGVPAVGVHELGVEG